MEDDFQETDFPFPRVVNPGPSSQDPTSDPSFSPSKPPRPYRLPTGGGGTLPLGQSGPGLVHRYFVLPFP